MLSNDQLEAIGGLIARYEKLSRVRRKRLQEADVRSGFIDPLFAILGWAMDQWDDVERETTVIEGKRPDYIFKIGDVPRLFLEAKPFRDDIYDQEETRKAITKAYNKGVPWVGVSNFERFVLYDAHEELTEAQPRRVFDLGYGDYLDTHAEAGIHLLAPGALQAHALEEYAQRIGARRSVVPIEKRLYESLRGWREDLFNALLKVNQWRTEAEYRRGDEAIQRLLDRLIFLRNCEDRGIGGTDLRGLRNRIRSRDRGVRVTESILRVFAQAATAYDSEIFQTGAVIDDLLRGTGTVLDDTLANIIEGLYSVPRSYSEYDFSQMEPDVLGEVYELYLGYVPQRVRGRVRGLATQPKAAGTRTEQITIEAKRQRRKEHGIYYTPRWVVKYIVQQTLGRFLDENRDNGDAVDGVTILDPAAGSGSFLIRAYETLLAHHAEQMGREIGHLDTDAREGILRRNVYGVDLDPQAVEIARLNLLIRMVRQKTLLPELKDNIRFGNSLIEGDGAALRPFFGERWKGTRPFDWQREFPEIMKRGGFDIIIGNPPYVRIQTLPRDERAYYKERYEATTGSYDMYCLFVERGLQLLRPGGLLGFIIPNKFMRSAYGKGLRSLLADAKAVWKLVDFGDTQIFESGTTYTCLLFLQKQPSEAVVYVPAAASVKADPARPNLAEAEEAAFPAKIDSTQPTWVFVPAPEDALMRKLRQLSTPLGDVCEKVFVGLQTSADDVYVMELLGEKDGKYRVRSRTNGREYALEKTLLKPLLSGHDIKRYWPPHSRFALLFPYEVRGRKATLITPDELSKAFPAAWDYLLENKGLLESREENKFKHDRWYKFGRSQNLGLHEEPKICVPRLVTRLVATYEADGSFYLDNVDVNGILGLTDPLYVLAILNSRLVNFYFRRITMPFRGGFRSANKQFIEPLPIRMPDRLTKAEAQAHDEIVSLTRHMLDLHQRLAVKGDVRDNECETIERDIQSTDREIDYLVYDLYRLSKKERVLVESETN